MNNLGKLLIGTGILLILIGVGVIVFSRFKFPFIGRLPGDIIISRKNFVFYFPLTTSIIINGILSLFFYLFFKK